MQIRLFANSQRTIRIQEIVGYAPLNQDRFIVGEEPQEVRYFSPSTPYGELWQRVTSNPLGKEWRYDPVNKQVILGSTISNTGESIIAISNGVKLFENVNTLSGLPYFLSSSQSVDDRTKIQQIWIHNDEPNKRYIQIRINNILDLVPSAGASPSWISFSLDGSNWFNTLQLPDLIGVSTHTFYVRAIVPQNMQVDNFRDVYFEFSYIEASNN